MSPRNLLTFLRQFTRLTILLVCFFITATRVSAQEVKADLLHGTDGRFDMSGFLATRGGFMPVPIVVTEPAIGYGGGLAAVFFHGGNPINSASRGPDGKPLTPSVTAGGAFATENGSKGAAVGHLGIWRNDTVRYIGAAAAASMNLEYWGVSQRPSETPLEYQVSGALIFQRLLFRVGKSPLLLGGEWTWSKQKAEFDLPSLPEGSPPPKTEQTDSGLGVVAEYDSLDNFFTPLHGIKARVVGKVFSKSIGGDNDRQKLDAEAFGYLPLTARLNLGLRGDLAFSDGDTPFYLLPYVSMRGLPALKYLGKHVALCELEARWSIDRRWSVIAFGGLGYTAKSASDLFKNDSIGTAGGGFRYLIAERLGIHAGLDYGQGPSPGDHAVYIIVGNAWR